jgi:hypothetical protein
MDEDEFKMLNISECDEQLMNISIKNIKTKKIISSKHFYHTDDI